MIYCIFIHYRLLDFPFYNSLPFITALITSYITKRDLGIYSTIYSIYYQWCFHLLPFIPLIPFITGAICRCRCRRPWSEGEAGGAGGREGDGPARCPKEASGSRRARSGSAWQRQRPPCWLPPASRVRGPRRTWWRRSPLPLTSWPRQVHMLGGVPAVTG